MLIKVIKSQYIINYQPASHDPKLDPLKVAWAGLFSAPINSNTEIYKSLSWK